MSEQRILDAFAAPDRRLTDAELRALAVRRFALVIRRLHEDLVEDIVADLGAAAATTTVGELIAEHSTDAGERRQKEQDA